MQAQLDIRTLIFVATILLVCRAAAMGYVWFVARQYAPIKYWAIGSALIAAGAFMIGLRDLIHPLISVALGQALLITGWLILDGGIVIAAGGKPPWRTGAAISLAGILLTCWALVIVPNLPLRTVFNSLPGILFDVYAAIACLRARHSRSKPTLVLLAVLLILLAASNLLKGAYIYSEDIQSLFVPAWQISQFYVCSFVMIVGGAVVFALLAVQSLQEQLDLELADRRRITDDLQAALRQTENFRNALDKVPAYVFMKDLNSRYTYANQPTLALFGCARSEVIGTDDSRFFPADTVTRLQEIDRKAFAGATTSEEVVVDAGTATQRVYLEVKTPIHDHANPDRIVGLCGISTDITALKEHAAELERLVRERTRDLIIAKDLAEAANRAKTTFLANISHELHTPLHGVLGMIGLAKRRVTDSKAVEQLDTAVASARTLLVILDDLLSLTRLEADRLSLETAPFMLGTLFNELDDSFRNPARQKHIEFAIDIPASLAAQSLLGDAGRLGLVLGKLLGNAIKFSDSGRIELRVRILEEDKSGMLLRFEVEDQGIGISPDDIDRLFVAFEQADGSMTRLYGGAGLGLAISKRIIRMMGGDIGVTSAPGQGSTFWSTVRFEKADPYANRRGIIG